MMPLIRLILNYISWGDLKSFVKFLKTNKIISKPSIVLAILITFCSYIIFNTIYFGDRRFDEAMFNTKLEKKIDSVLVECGNKTAVSVATVSIKQQADASRKAVYKIVKACDIIVKDCIVDLWSSKSIYGKETYNVDLNTYSNLVKWSQENFPKSFSLRIDGKQDLSAVDNYPTIRN